MGLVASTDTFYPGQERYDHEGRHVLSTFRGSTLEWRRLGVLGYDMEAATLLTFAGVTKVRAGAIKGVAVNRARQETVRSKAADLAEDKAAAMAMDGLRALIEADAAGRTYSQHEAG